MSGFVRVLVEEAPDAKQEEFERRLREDAAFASNPRARLEFFLRRHSSWDSRLNLYPVFRVDELLASSSAAR